MSVLIKGVKMPTSCLKGGCPLDGSVCQLWEDKYWANYKDPEKGRHHDCPLIELPDHGDLIDRDVVVARLAEWSKRLIETYGENDEYVNCLSEVLEGLGSAPVVIPAERDVNVCPLHSDDEVTEYCVEGPCTDEMEGRCPIPKGAKNEANILHLRSALV